jgi:hypothetical protein
MRIGKKSTPPATTKTPSPCLHTNTDQWADRIRGRGKGRELKKA